MKNLIHTMLSIALVFCMVSIALARGAPPEQNAVTAQAVMVDVAPIVASVPPLTVGYDVILNIAVLPNSQSVPDRTTVKRRQSTTGDERGLRADSYLTRTGPEPAMVLLA